MNQDHTSRLDDELFEYQIIKDNKIQINFNSKPVMMLKGYSAQDHMRKLERSDEKETQLVLTKITGNFKRGNEKSMKKQK